MSKLEYVSPEGLRLDGRRVHELRKIRVRLGQTNGADGSAYIEQGNTKVLATVHGPHEAPRSRQDHSRAVINCQYNVASFATNERKERSASDRRLVETSAQVRSAFEAAILTSLYPKTQIDLFVQILQSDGGEMAAAINAITLALMDAGIAMQDFVCACTAGYVDGHSILDMNHQESTAHGPELTVAYCNRMEKVVLTQMKSRVHADHFDELHRLAVIGCSSVAETFTNEVKMRVEELIPSLGPQL